MLFRFFNLFLVSAYILIRPTFNNFIFVINDPDLDVVFTLQKGGLNPWYISY